MRSHGRLKRIQGLRRATGFKGISKKLGLQGSQGALHGGLGVLQGVLKMFSEPFQSDHSGFQGVP